MIQRTMLAGMVATIANSVQLAEGAELQHVHNVSSAVVLQTEPRGNRRLQAAQMIGGRPPKHIQTELCDIRSVFGSLTDITSSPACRSGCDGGSGLCSEPWYPGAADSCNAECGTLFEPFCKLC